VCFAALLSGPLFFTVFPLGAFAATFFTAVFLWEGLPFFAALAAFARRLVLDDTSKVTASFARAIAAVAC